MSSNITNVLNCYPYSSYKKAFSGESVNHVTSVEKTYATCMMFGYVTSISCSALICFHGLVPNFEIQVKCLQTALGSFFIIYVSSGNNHLEEMGDGFNLFHCFIKRVPSLLQ